jgi:hypothetical protein
MLSTDRPLTEQTYPTLLRTPGRYGFPNERILPGSASDYITEAVHPGWMLGITTGDEIVYFGPGPAGVVSSPAPF